MLSGSLFQNSLVNLKGSKKKSRTLRGLNLGKLDFSKREISWRKVKDWERLGKTHQKVAVPPNQLRTDSSLNFWWVQFAPTQGTPPPPRQPALLPAHLQFLGKEGLELVCSPHVENEWQDIKQGSCKDILMGTMTRQILCSQESLRFYCWFFVKM